MIYVVIGQAGSGKTTFVRTRWFRPGAQIREKPIAHTVTCDGGTILLGKYGIDKRCEGTDTLSYSALPLIKEFVAENAARMNIVLEGDRITNDSFFSWLQRGWPKRHQPPIKLFLVRCPIMVSMQRLRNAGSDITEQFVRATKTKSTRLFIRYGKKWDGEIVNTAKGR